MKRRKRTEGGAGYKTRDERTLGVVTARYVEALNSVCLCASMLAFVYLHVDWVYQQLDGCEN